MNEIFSACAKALAAWRLPGKNFCKRAAFSLVELLMALLVASLLMAALAPVMTKKFTDGTPASLTESGNIGDRGYWGHINNDDSEAVLDQSSGDNQGFIVPEDVGSINAIIVGGGGGGAGAVNSVQSSVQNKLLVNHTGAVGAGNTNLSSANTYNFTQYVDKMTVTLVGGGGGGGGSNGQANHTDPPAFHPKSSSDCGNWGVFITSAQNGGKGTLCVSKYNAGQHNEPYAPPFPSSSQAITIDTDNNGTMDATVQVQYHVANSTTGTGNCDNANCCWTSNNGTQPTANPSYCDDNGKGTFPKNGMNYGGCYRPVCQWRAAAAICKNWNPTGDARYQGRLPSYKELQAWQAAGQLSDRKGTPNLPGLMNWDGVRGLQLCDGDTPATLGSVRCNGYGGACKGAASQAATGQTHWVDYCYPNHFWAGTANGSEYRDAYLDTGNYGVSSYKSTLAFSVRCVLGTASAFNSFSGGGGSSGIYARIEVPEAVLKYATRGNTVAQVKTYAGSGGAGGAAKSSAAAIGGSPSRVEILDGNNNVVWGVQVPGGRGGTGASTTSGGAGASALSDTSGNNCHYLHTTAAGGSYNSWTAMNCSQIPSANAVLTAPGDPGHNGTTSESGGTGGYGGRGFWESRDTAYAEPNQDGAKIGAGGGGGECVYDASATDGYSCKAGGKGGAGRVMVTYGLKVPGIGGAGGGAGGVLQVRNIPVTPGQLVKVRVGAGGAAGAPGRAGYDGEGSEIEVNGTKYTVSGGKGGATSTLGNPNHASFNYSVTTSMLTGTGALASSGILPTAAATGGAGTDLKNPDGLIFNGKAGSAAVASAPVTTSPYLTYSPGGNGGVNDKVTKSDHLPCGGFSAQPITLGNKGLSCGNSSLNPLQLTREKSFDVQTLNPQTSATFFGGGATGGGGGAWREGMNGATSASAGSIGLGGYVFIYYGSW